MKPETPLVIRARSEPASRITRGFASRSASARDLWLFASPFARFARFARPKVSLRATKGDEKPLVKRDEGQGIASPKVRLSVTTAK